MKRKRCYAYKVGIFEARSLVTINSECIQIAGGCDLQLNVSLLEHNVFQSYIFFFQSLFEFQGLLYTCVHESVCECFLEKKIKYTGFLFSPFAVYLLTSVIFLAIVSLL